MNVIGQVTVNESGDVAISKSICEQAGLRPGAELIVEKNGAGEIRLRRAENGSAETTMNGEAELIEENGLLVIKGGADVDIISLIEQDREERMRKLMKGSGSEPAAQEEVRLVYEGSVLVAQTEVLEDMAENGITSSLPKETTMEGGAELVKKNGFWVIRGVPAELLENIVERERKARINELIRRTMNPEEETLESSD